MINIVNLGDITKLDKLIIIPEIDEIRSLKSWIIQEVSHASYLNQLVRMPSKSKCTVPERPDIYGHSQSSKT
jgi:hypothetical protein